MHYQQTYAPGVGGRLCTDSGLASSEQVLAEFRESSSRESEDACDDVGVPEAERDCALTERASTGGTTGADVDTAGGSDDIVITWNRLENCDKNDKTECGYIDQAAPL